MADETKIIVRRDRRTSVRPVVMAAGFVLCSIWIIAAARGFPAPIAWLFDAVAVFGGVFFGLCAVVLLAARWSRNPVAVITKQGLYDNASLAAAGFVPFDDMQDVYVTTVRSQRCLTVVVATPQTYIDRQNALLRPVSRANAEKWGSPVQLSELSLGRQFDEVAAHLRQGVENNSA